MISNYLHLGMERERGRKRENERVKGALHAKIIPFNLRNSMAWAGGECDVRGSARGRVIVTIIIFVS